MISLYFAFWMFVIFFAVAGAMRGWASELLVTFSAVLAIFIIVVLGELNLLPVLEAKTQFYVQAGTLLVLAFFGYQTPRFPIIARAKVAREKVQDALLGFVVGGVNGYLVMGSLWHYFAAIGYKLNESPIEYITPPDGLGELGTRTLQLMDALPPMWLQAPLIYVAIIIAFAFVIIVFV
jgi:hypothetical protein